MANSTEIPPSLTTSTYDRLRNDLATLLQHGQQDALNRLNEIRVNTYWQMGKRMSEEKELIDFDQSATFIARLAADLNLDTSLIYRILLFYRTWPDGIPRIDNTPALSWTHFTELLAIRDTAERDFYLETASKEEWGRNMLRKAIQKDLFTTSQKSKKPVSHKTLERDPNPLYTYKAVVEKVVDGDTLLVRIDLGFNVWVNQRIRLRGINTEELDRHPERSEGSLPSSSPSPLEGDGHGNSPSFEKGGNSISPPLQKGGEGWDLLEGARGIFSRATLAKQFVEEKLQEIEFIVIKTYKTDMYGRYVADVFYHPTIKKKEEVAEKGFFLNAQLLDEGLVDLMLGN